MLMNLTVLLSSQKVGVYMYIEKFSSSHTVDIHSEKPSLVPLMDRTHEITALTLSLLAFLTR